MLERWRGVMRLRSPLRRGGWVGFSFRFKQFVLIRHKADRNCTLCGVNFFDQRLRPGERLKSRTQIEAAFKSGLTVKAYPLLLVYQRVERSEGQPQAQVGFVAPKKAFRRAHDRNFVKRRMRESYRLGKADFYRWLTEREQCWQGMLIFTGRELPTQTELDRTWRKLLRRIDADFFG